MIKQSRSSCGLFFCVRNFVSPSPRKGPPCAQGEVGRLRPGEDRKTDDLSYIPSVSRCSTAVAITDCSPLWLKTCHRHVFLTRRAHLQQGEPWCFYEALPNLRKGPGSPVSLPLCPRGAVSAADWGDGNKKPLPAHQSVGRDSFTI